MNRQEFLMQLRKGLEGLPKNDIEERLAFYEEMIEDRMVEGYSEEEAVKAIGTIEEIVAQTISETPLIRIARERIKLERKLTIMEIVLLIIGSPIWFSLVVACLAVVLSLYVALWAIIISLWVIFGALIVCAVCGLIACIVNLISGKAISGFIILSIGFICGGLSIFMFYGCKIVTKFIVQLTKKITMMIKNCFIKKEKMK